MGFTAAQNRCDKAADGKIHKRKIARLNNPFDTSTSMTQARGNAQYQSSRGALFSIISGLLVVEERRA
jgi:hypothetical protein